MIPSEWLPTRVTPLIGRDVLLCHARAALDNTRVLTFVGPGGAGKTRLAAEIAAASIHPVVLVRLALVTEPGDVLQAIATAAGVEVGADRTPLDACAEAFTASTLLVLDNCEQVVESCAAAVHELVARCDLLTVVTTSREAMRVAGERLVPVPPLESSYAVQLFVDRVSRVHPDFNLTDDNSQVVEQICRRLDGLPLALELAAARARALSLADIATALDAGAPLEAVTPRSLPERHRSLSSCLEWSYRLLTDEEQHVLRASAVFAGGFDVAALAYVAERDAAACLETVAGLVDKSLVEVDRRTVRTRYRLLETIRDFAVRQPAEASFRDRHTRWYLDRVIGYDPAELTHDWVLRVRQEWAADVDNLRLALTASAGCSPGERLLAAAGASLVLDSHEAAAWLERAIADTSAEAGVARAHAILALAGTDVRAGVRRKPLLDEACRWVDHLPQGFAGLALTYAATAHLMAGEARTGLRLLDEARRLDTGTPFAGFNLISAAVQQVIDGRLDQALTTARRAIDVSSGPGVDGPSMRALGIVLTHRADIDAAFEALTEADALAASSGPWWIAHETPGDLGYLHLMRGDDDLAQMHAHEALARESAGRSAATRARVVLGLLDLRAGDPGSALAPLLDVATSERAGGRRQLLTMQLPYLAEAFRASGLRDDARQAVDECLGYCDRAESRLGQRLTLWVLARLDLQAGNATAGVRNAAEALRICHEHGYRLHLADHMEELAGHLLPGRESLAARAYGAADRLRSELGTVPYPLTMNERAADRRTCEQADDYRAAYDDGYAADPTEVVETLLRQAAGRRTTTVGWDALTPSELDVARLVADHLTNPQIAERLFISVNTVKTHLTHIFTKLDISSKSELVALLTARRQ